MPKNPTPQNEEPTFLFPKNEDGMTLCAFLVTVKITFDIQNDTSPWRFIVFANTGVEAHDKIVQHLNRGEYREGSYRVSVEMARLASGSMGIIEL